MRRRGAWPPLIVASALLVASGSARGDESSKVCARSFEESQYLQKDGKLLDARLKALACGASTCPAFIREACQKILADIDSAQPTVVLAVHDAAGADLVDVRVDLDGHPFLPRVGAQAVPVDPGDHTFRFFHADDPPVEEHALIRVSEKNRIVRVAFSASTRSEPVVATPPPAVQPTSFWAAAWPSVVVGALGLGAVGASVGVGVDAKNDADNLRATCAPRCTTSAVNDVNSRLLVSDVLLGAGVVVVGVATVLFFVRHGSHESKPAAWRLVPGPSGGVALGF